MRRVIKYGGTSIESADRVRRAAKNVARLLHEGDQVAVVVSAQGNDTNQLLAQVYSVTERAGDAASTYRVAALGEEKSVHLMAAALRSLGVEAVPLAPADPERWPLVVDSDDATPIAAQKINEERPLEVQDRECQRLFGKHVIPALRRGAVPVVSGFFARSSGGALTTLGRGGSDITAVLCGKFAEADEVTIVTDVEGILSADPRLAEDVQLIEQMSVEELEVMASRGARVLHPRAIRFKPDALRVRVVDFRRQEALSSSGTTLVGSSTPSLDAREDVLAMVTLIGRDLSARAGLLGELGSILGREGIAIAASNSNDAYICLYLLEKDAERAYRLLHAALLVAGSSFTNVTLRRDVAEIRLRSPAFLQTPGVLAEITGALGRRRVNILEMITSLTDIYIYVDSGDRPSALELLRGLLD
jgi:aspartate kinase